ncbi:hypothetical protein [Magnetospirillum aberrantis]|uniref:Uncharacterized protein n=1 Tax=Magnetospirillum aberrantis SpK TaxID=908842 RepID=A0A7C9QSM1_9PROT|nr:hypothetical protein [Magnetospirillum aberrantis]NFV79560.1 hypothetical protein [Magnetospirillum aberrantis SpK]
MAMGTNKVSAIASPGMAAAATARPASGGRNVASVGSAGIESTEFSSQIGVNDNRLWRYDEEQEFNLDHGQDQQKQATPFIVRSANGFKVEEAEETSDAGGSGGKVFLDTLMRGIGIYESNMRRTMPGAVRPGSVLNFRY